MSYLFSAFLGSDEPPGAEEARDYLLEGALFDETPTIDIERAAGGAFARMALRYDDARRPIVLRRLTGDDADAARGEAVDLATACGRGDIAAAITAAPLVLEWEIERAELDEDAWFALHLWQAWVLGPSQGWLHAPGDGLFDAELQRRCEDGGPSPAGDVDA